MDNSVNERSVVRYGKENVGGLDIFYREAGSPSNPAVVLLHGFPTSSHMYREVLRSLGDEFYLVAPDYPGFGDSSFPPPGEFEYTFDNIAGVVNAFLEKKGITKYSLMMQDFGAPVGFRIASQSPGRVRSLIIQNGNAYEEGLDPATWQPVFEYWKDRKAALEQALVSRLLSLEGIRSQYTHGTRNPDGILPDNWNLDFLKMSRPGQDRAQLDLFYDYRNNLKSYPEWQKYLRENQPPVLITWGKNDQFFPEPGAEAYKRDVRNIDYNILDTGHFALEEDHVFITGKMREFLNDAV
ncbi:MAG: alpha/beta hydrolase [Candidatus Dadabacteria bacterium]|nr:alpha/beta hydrolase [Candidatus Dadabacteria bacterium]